MCGIVGIYHSNGKINPTLLESAMETLSHRGPDGRGIWLSTDQHVGLAHTRLSIVDIKGGAQPISNQSRTIYASVNGEFYEYNKIRKKLESAGHQFLTRSDSELVIHLYQEYDLDFVHYLRGEFAFVLYDVLKKRMIVIRDRFGVKPLCYSSSEGVFYVASEAKAILKLGVSPAWNEYALYHSFCFQYSPVEQTLFKNIHQVPPGHMIIYDGKNVASKRYWDLNYHSETESRSLDFDTLSSELDHQLKEAIDIRRPVDDIPVCCHLSGGVDSATIAALARDLYGKPLPCFTVSFPHDDYNEVQYAENLAKKIEAPFHPVFVDAEDLVDVISDAVYFSEGLAINNHLSAKFILNREIKKAGFKIALTGEGADELFAGYMHLQQDYLPQKRDHGIGSGIYISEDQTLPLHLVKNQLGYIPSFLRAKAAIGQKIHNLLDLDAIPFSSDEVFTHILKSNILVENSDKLAQVVNQSTYLWIKFALSGYILKTLGDGCEMAHGIEGRVPFLDHNLFKFAKKIPLSLKIKPDTDKFILRETFKKYITPEIAQRKKQPFIAPPFSLLTNKKGYEFMRDSLQSCHTIPYINSKKVALYLDEILRKPTQYQIAAEPVVMLILTAALLNQRYSMS